MEIDHGIVKAQTNAGATQDALEELTVENARLRRLVGELLLKNQRLREDAVIGRAG